MLQKLFDIMKAQPVLTPPGSAWAHVTPAIHVLLFPMHCWGAAVCSSMP